MRRVGGQVGVVRSLHAPRRTCCRPSLCLQWTRRGLAADSSGASGRWVRACRQLGCSRRRFARRPRVAVGPRRRPDVAEPVTRWREGGMSTGLTSLLVASALEGRWRETGAAGAVPAAVVRSPGPGRSEQERGLRPLVVSPLSCDLKDF